MKKCQVGPTLLRRRPLHSSTLFLFFQHYIPLIFVPFHNRYFYEILVVFFLFFFCCDGAKNTGVLIRLIITKSLELQINTHSFHWFHDNAQRVNWMTFSSAFPAHSSACFRNPEFPESSQHTVSKITLGTFAILKYPRWATAVVEKNLSKRSSKNTKPYVHLLLNRDTTDDSPFAILVTALQLYACTT